MANTFSFTFVTIQSSGLSKRASSIWVRCMIAAQQWYYRPSLTLHRMFTLIAIYNRFSNCNNCNIIMYIVLYNTALVRHTDAIATMIIRSFAINNIYRWIKQLLRLKPFSLPLPLSLFLIQLYFELKTLRIKQHQFRFDQT